MAERQQSFIKGNYHRIPWMKNMKKDPNGHG